jgi:hypothetical protein
VREVGAFITGEDLQQGNKVLYKGAIRFSLLQVLAGDESADLSHATPRCLSHDLAWRMIPDVPFCSVLFRDRVGMDLHLSRATHEVQQQDVALCNPRIKYYIRERFGSPCCRSSPVMKAPTSR